MGKAAYDSGAQKNSWHDYALRLLNELTCRLSKLYEN